MNEEPNIKISITKDEALVLFEFLVRFNKTVRSEIFDDQAEQKTLWILEAQLEKQLLEPFKSDYIQIITEARKRIRDTE